MDIGKESTPYVIEPIESPVPGKEIPAPPEPVYEPVPEITPEREKVPA